MNFTLYYRYLLNQNSLKESIYRYLKNEIYYYEVLYEDTKETLNKLIKSFVHTKKSKLLLKQLDNNWKLK